MSSTPGSFEEFFDHEIGRVVSFLMKAGFDFEAARDAAAEAMCRAWDRWSTIDAPRSWVYKVALNIATNKTLRERDGIERALAGGWVAPQFINPCAVVDEYDEVLTVLSVLPSKQRLVMAWTMHDFKTCEIADLLEIKEPTVRSHLRHARTRLRKHYEAARQKQREPHDPMHSFNADSGDL